jgi:predicted ArsR family transcriptional regulator
MVEDFVTSDLAILDWLRKSKAMNVVELARSLQVTPTAVRQRLNRLMAQGYIERRSIRKGRGRPSHDYLLTNKGRRKAGSNFADLAMVLWEEIKRIDDAEIRRALLARLAKRLAVMYSNKLVGQSLEEKLHSLAEIFAERRIPLDIDESGALPVLTASACPYPDLAEADRSVCAMERMMFSELLGADVHLSACRLDGESCCTFHCN